MRWVLPILILTVLAAGGLACGGAGAPGSTAEGFGDVAVGKAAPAALSAREEARFAVAQAGAPTADLPPATERLIIRNGNISLRVANLDASVQAVTALAQELDGFVVSSQRQGEEASAFAQVTFRVPAESFDTALARLRSLAVRVESEGTDSQDVTEQFIDLQARFRTLRATEEQLLALLDRAETVEEVLKVHTELSRLRSEIESLQGRIQFLERSAAFSLISVTLLPVTSPAPLVNPRWDALETVRDAVRDLAGSLQGLATLGIRLAVFAPLWAPPALLALWGVWRWRRRRPRLASEETPSR